MMDTSFVPGWSVGLLVGAMGACALACSGSDPLAPDDGATEPGLGGAAAAAGQGRSSSGSDPAAPDDGATEHGLGGAAAAAGQGG
ncbi:MAG: hypothetical protein JW940_37430, partial [Polyangiaceae bacterium]|nr:hypothetical protein [Polyangiaceae bacterium]